MDPTLRRRIAAALLVAVVALAALAIADVGPFEDPITEEERVRITVERFFGAAAESDGKTFCELLTGDARETLRENTAQQLQTDDPPSCAELLTTLGPIFAGSRIEVLSVSISGIRARVDARYKLEAGAAEQRTILLEQEEGEWRISDPG